MAGKRRKRRTYASKLTSVAVGVAGLAFPAVAAAGTLDQSQTLFFHPLYVGLGAERQAAQTFTVGLSGGLDRIDVYVGRNQAPADRPPCDSGSGITVEIRTLTGASPGNTTLARANVPAGGVPTSWSWVSFGFAAPAPVTAGTQYALALSAPDASCGASDEAYGWGGANGDYYPNGGWYRSFDGGASWTFACHPPPSVPCDPDPDSSDLDGAFKAYVAPNTRTLSIGYSERKGKFRGKLASQSPPTCSSDEKVSVFKKKRGKDPKLGSDTTRENGKYSLKERNAEGKFYARVKQTSISGGTCLAAKSETIEVG
jgi:hypothetical protein